MIVSEIVVIGGGATLKWNGVLMVLCVDKELSKFDFFAFFQNL